MFIVIICDLSYKIILFYFGHIRINKTVSFDSEMPWLLVTAFQVIDIPPLQKNIKITIKDDKIFYLSFVVFAFLNGLQK